MIGVPYWLNTKEDVQRCVEYAKQGMLDKKKLAERIRALLSDAKVWEYAKDVDKSYKPAEDEKVMKVEDIADDGSTTTKYVCFKLVDNKNARFLRMGLTKEEIDTILTELEG